jgi:AAA domain
VRLVWINGPFGVGKTTVAQKLIERWPEAILYDPELIGALLRILLPAPLNMGDFQDIPLWRRLVRVTAIEMLSQYEKPLVVPMTLVVPDYFEEIVGGLRQEGVHVDHFTLVATDETIMARVRGSDREEWAISQLRRCLAGLRDPRFARHIDVDTASADVVADEIASSVLVGRATG